MVFLVSFLSIVLPIVYFLVPFVIAVPPIIYGEPSPLLSDDIVNSSYILTSPSGTTQATDLQGAKVLRRRLTKNDYLRILPLGASITQGVKSSSDNGYRK